MSWQNQRELHGDGRCKTDTRDRIPMAMNRGADHNMTITIRLSDEEQQRRAERAARNGRFDSCQRVHVGWVKPTDRPVRITKATASAQGRRNGSE
jgi:hypothetical protein